MLVSAAWLAPRNFATIWTDFGVVWSEDALSDDTALTELLFGSAEKSDDAIVTKNKLPHAKDKMRAHDVFTKCLWIYPLEG